MIDAYPLDPDGPHLATPMDSEAEERGLCRFCGARVWNAGQYAGWHHEDPSLDLNPPEKGEP